MKARLFSKTGLLNGLQYIVEEDAIIGRGKNSQIQLEVNFLSKQHARIYFSESESAFLIEDLESSHGTWLDGRRLLRPTKLGRLHVITLAENIDLICQTVADDFWPRREIGLRAPIVIEKTLVAPASSSLPAALRSDSLAREAGFGDAHPKDAADDSGSASARTVVAGSQDDEPTSVEDPALPLPGNLARDLGSAADFTDQAGTVSEEDRGSPDDLSRFLLIVRMENATARTYRLRVGLNSVGRQPGCDIRISHPTVSREHATLRVAGDRVTIFAQGGVNPLLVNGSPIAEETEIHPGETLHLGEVTSHIVILSP